ncbi:MAG: hypothetical protein GY822_07485 [Deltaproteobacteria bacterium]|nr:hypothetical protein [Deltaproteobacteria bacterium]
MAIDAGSLKKDAGVVVREQVPANEVAKPSKARKKKRGRNKRRRKRRP